MKTHIQVVAALHIALGVLSLIAAIIIFLALGLASGIVISQGERGAAGIVGVLAVVLGGLLAVLSLPGIIGGWALWSGKPWGRPVAFGLGIFCLLNIPF